MWRELAARNWSRVADHLSDDCIYFDVPYGPALSARGPADIVARLKVGLEPLAAYTNHDGVLVADGADVLYEHAETWEWSSGESVVLPFVTVHRVADGRITLWKDYWDATTLVSAAPAEWMTQLASADTDWLYDATDEFS
nr:nuclear transport factor 2 family protein [Gordonia soli]